ncbi:MAG TPA: FAD-dependent oxidoreductase, partial [Solirubrobacterales bacterium]|nr:FAD-dependent oxidoreductase [Solirubrobacterales bacterium]
PEPDRLRLAEAMRPGLLCKCLAVYEQPFWRQDGLSGEAVADADPVTLTFDATPPGGGPGVLIGFVGGPEAERFVKQDPDERRAAVIACLADLFGPRAAEPLRYLEQLWPLEEWSGGGPTGNFAPGGWTGPGRALRRPHGPVHWAGTETATVWSGYMEGALQSGERVAAEVRTAA